MAFPLTIMQLVNTAFACSSDSSENASLKKQDFIPFGVCLYSTAGVGAEKT